MATIFRQPTVNRRANKRFSPAVLDSPQNRLNDLYVVTSNALPIGSQSFPDMRRRNRRIIERLYVAPAFPGRITSSPILPATVDTTLPTGWDGVADATPADSAALATALAAVNQNAGRPWIIELTAGVTYTGNFVHQNNTGSQWLILRSSGYASLPATGTRVSTSDASHMAKIVTANNDRAIFFNHQSHHFRAIGIEVTTTYSATVHSGLVFAGQLDDKSTYITSNADWAHHIILDRCWLHGTSTADLARAVTADCNYFAIIDSYVNECHVVGQDAQAVWWADGQGPHLIHNNHLEASGENVMIGGADPGVPYGIPSDITITNNYFYKPLSWKVDDPSYAGIHWSVKNLFEIKNAQRVLFDGNILENNWPDAQTGTAINIKSNNQGDTAPWTAARDITFTNNIIRNTAGGITIITDDGTDGHISTPMERVQISNNLFLTDPATWGGEGKLMFLLDGGLENGHDVVIKHNTMLMLSESGTSLFIAISGTIGICDNLILNDNLASAGTYGIKADSTPEGTASLNTIMGYTFHNNVLIGASNVYPATTLRPADGFTNYAGGDYSLTSGSAYHNAATDGTDIGVDWAALQAATANTVNGAPITDPVITSNGGGSTASISVAENTTAVTTVVATGSPAPTYSITGGADQAKFDINSTTGVLTFHTAPDYETPTDANTDNAYIVIVTATVAGAGSTDSQTITVTVTDVAESSGSAVPQHIGIGIGIGF